MHRNIGASLLAIVLAAAAWAVGPAFTGAPVWAAADPAAGSASILPPEKDLWIQIQTAHFTLISNAPDRRTLDLGRRLERFRAVLGRFNKKFRVDSAATTTIFVFKDDASFTPYKKRFNGKPVEMAGMFLGHPDGNYMMVNGARQGDPLEVIYHEYVHHFLGNNLHNIPAWFNEGMAECYSGFRADEKTASIGLTQTEHVYLLRDHALMPLRDLFAISERSAEYNEGDRRSIFYAESWALMHYLLWDKPERRPQFVDFLERLAQGEPADAAFPAAFGTTYEKVENELRQYVGQARYMLTVYKVSDLAIDDSAKSAPLTRAQTLSRLGDLLAHVDPGRAAEAETLFREAQRLAPDDAGSYAGLGYLALLHHRLDDAVTLNEKALTLDPKDAMIAFHLGQALARRASGAPVGTGEQAMPADLVRAADMFGQAIKARYEFGEAYVEYAGVIMRQGFAYKAAIPLLEAARVLLPSRIDVVVNLAGLYAAAGQADRARNLVESVIARMNDPEALEVARDNIRRTAEGIARQSRAEETARDATGREAAAREETGREAAAREAQIPSGDTVDVYNKQVAVYNEAVALANRREYKAAIARLEKLLTEVTEPDLKAQVADFLARLKKDAARLQKQPG